MRRHCRGARRRCGHHCGRHDCVDGHDRHAGRAQLAQHTFGVAQKAGAKGAGGACYVCGARRISDEVDRLEIEHCVRVDAVL